MGHIAGDREHRAGARKIEQGDRAGCMENRGAERT